MSYYSGENLNSLTDYKVWGAIWWFFYLGYLYGQLNLIYGNIYIHFLFKHSIVCRFKPVVSGASDATTGRDTAHLARAYTGKYIISKNSDVSSNV